MNASLQIVEIVRVARRELPGELLRSDREVPPLTGVNGTVMAW
jgi:hypothetical protein